MIYFKDYEITCKCGCGQLIVNKELFERLSRARELANIPFNVTSWNRCKFHNRMVGGSKTSGHLDGEAVDISFKDNHEKFIMTKALFDSGFKRIGTNEAKKFLHIDVTEYKAQETLFSY